MTLPTIATEMCKRTTVVLISVLKQSSSRKVAPARTSARHSVAPLMLVATLAMTSVLAGCSNGDGKSAVASEPLSATVSAAEATTEATTEAFTIPPIKELYPHPKPEMPALAKEHSKEGAMAFAAYFLEGCGYSLVAQDLDFFSRFCAPDAKYCRDQVEAIKGAAASDSYFKDLYFHDLVATGALVGGQKPRVEWGVQVIGFADDSEVVLSAGHETRPVKGMKLVSGIDLYWDDGWKVSEAQVVPYEDVYDD